MVRVFCMILTCIYFTILTSHIVEGFLLESMNIQGQNEHLHMIEKLQRKYAISGAAKKFLNLLGSSV